MNLKHVLSMVWVVLIKNRALLQKTIYVDSSIGKDPNGGSKESPFKPIAAAMWDGYQKNIVPNLHGIFSTYLTIKRRNAIIFAILLNLLFPIYSWSNPTVTSVSFELTHKMIIVKASVNGREGLFILDTGVSEVILNNRYFNGRPTGDKFYGVNGNEISKKIEVIRFNFGGFEEKVVANVTDFSAMEEYTGLELFGVIGNSIFKNCEIVLDYVFQEVTIYQLDKKGNRMSPKNIHKKPLDTLSFFTGRGLPYIAVDINGQRLNMIVDSGASANVMDIRQIKRLSSDFLRAQENSLASFGSKGVSAKSQFIDNLMVGNLTFPAMKTLFINLDHFNQSQRVIRADGILGYEFLSNFRVAINFRKKEIYLWDRESVELQWTIAKNLEN